MVIAVMVIVVDADLLGSATEVATAATIAGEGAFAGAVKVIAAPEALAAADNVPHDAPLQPAPLKDHVTPLFCESF